MNDMQKLVDICFEIGLTISDPEFNFYKKSQEERAKWIARQLRMTGFPTNPSGASWGVLEQKEAPPRPVIEKRPSPMLVTEGVGKPARRVAS